MSVDQVSSLPGGVTGGGLGGITGVLQGGVSSLLNSGQGYLDRFFPPGKREELKNKIAQFATERPYLASFLLSQIALSGPALALFIIMTLTVAIFSLITALLVAVIGALLFIVGAVGVALFFLLPTLFVTTLAAVGIWLWGVGAYLIIKWFNKKDVPGIHSSADGALKQTGLDGVLGGVTKNLPIQGKDENDTQADKDEKHINGVKASGTDAGKPHAERRENHSRPPKLEATKAINGTIEHKAPVKLPDTPVKVPEIDGPGPVGAVGDVTKKLGI